MGNCVLCNWQLQAPLASFVLVKLSFCVPQAEYRRGRWCVVSFRSGVSHFIRVSAGGPAQAALPVSSGHAGPPRWRAWAGVCSQLPASLLPWWPPVDHLEGPLGPGGQSLFLLLPFVCDINMGKSSFTIELYMTPPLSDHLSEHAVVFCVYVLGNLGQWEHVRRGFKGPGSSNHSTDGAVLPSGWPCDECVSKGGALWLRVDWYGY